MTSSYSQQGRPNLAPYPNSPHQIHPSPRLANAQPVQQQQGPMGMQQAYPQGYGYPPHMYQQVNPHSPRNPYRGSDAPKGPHATRAPLLNLAHGKTPIDLSPGSGQFEQILTGLKQGAQFMYADPNYQYYPQFPGGMPAMQQGMYMPSGSPRPSQVPQGAQQYLPSPYPPPTQAPSMSRTSSAVSASVSERPVSSSGRTQTPATSNAQTTQPGRGPPAPSPAPSSAFQRPAKRGSAAILIKDPTTLAVKSFDKSSSADGRSSQSPAKAATSTPTPPPRTASSSSTQHNRTESKTTKTAEEKRNEFRDSIAKNLEAERTDQQKPKEDDSAKTEDKDAEMATLVKEKADIEARELEAGANQLEAEAAAKQAKAEAETAAKIALAAEEQSKDDAESEEARRKREEDEEFARIEAEMEEAERQEAEREAAYQRKKEAEKEETARKEAEAAATAEAEMKKLEQEAEEREEARLKKLEESEGGDAGKQRQDLFATLKKGTPASPSGSDAATPAIDTPEESGPATPASEVSMPPPNRAASAQKHKPASLVIPTSKTVEPDQPSAALKSLLSARKLASLNDVQYPSAINSPNPALNSSAPPGHFRYDRSFLMQFQKAYKEAPSEGWATKVKSTVGDTSAEPGSASARSASGRGGPVGMGSRQPSLAGRPQTMGQFGAGAPAGGRTLPPGTTSQARFAASNNAMNIGRGAMTNPLQNIVQGRPGGFPMQMGAGMIRTPSSTNMHPQSPRGNPSQRGNPSRTSKGGKRENEKDNKSMPLTAGAALKPIEISATGWKPSSVGRTSSMAGPTPGGDGLMPPDVVQKKVKSQLNKMTPSNFDKISSQILEIVGQSKHESDGRTLRQVIQLTFEKATDEAHWAEMYANFCKRMQENMSPEIKDEDIKKDGRPVVGGALFRKYLLNRCQAEFERGWKANLPEEGSVEAKLMSEEYYVAAAAKRRGLGLVRFIGELYKLGMLTERIMHECVKKLVDYEGIPDEAEVESLTSLLKTIGLNLDSAPDPRNRKAMDAYFARIIAMMETDGLPSRLRFMLMVSDSLHQITELNTNVFKGYH